MDYVTHAIHGRAVAQQAVNTSSTEHLLSSGELAGHGGAAAGAINCKPQFLHIERLFQEIDGAIAEKLKRGSDVLAPSEGDDRGREWKLRGGPQKIALRLFFGSKVQQNCVGVAVGDFSDRLLRRENLPDTVARFTENLLQNIAKGFIRIDQQNAFNSFP
jgi:hypothetical protein